MSDISPLLALHAALKMNGRLLVALALGAAVVNIAHGTIVLLGTGTAVAATGVTVSGAALAAGAATVGALALAAAVVGKAVSRGKREAACLPFSSPEVYFNMAANADFLDCGRRYVCELEATPDNELVSGERLLRTLFVHRTQANSGPAGNFFFVAGEIGAQNGTSACAEAYRTCPFSRKEIYSAFTEMQNSA